MKKLFQSLLGGNKEKESDNEDKKKFDVLKFDGMRAQRTGNLTYAIKCYTGALEIEEDFETLNYLSQTYLQAGEVVEAQRVLERMAALEPELVIVHLTLANVYYMEELYAPMAEAAKRALAVEPENPAAFYLLAKANKGTGDLLGAIVNLTKALAVKADFIEALLLRAEILQIMQQNKESLEDVESVLALHGEEENALLLRARIREATGEEAGAEEDYKQITELNPFNEQAYLGWGKLYIHQKRLEEAIELLNEAIELNPKAASAYYERGRAKLLNGDKEGSTEDMKIALQLNPKENEAITGMFKN